MIKFHMVDEYKKLNRSSKRMEVIRVYVPEESVKEEGE